MGIEQVVMVAIFFISLLYIKASDAQEVFLLRKAGVRHYIVGCLVILLAHPFLSEVAVKERGMYASESLGNGTYDVTGSEFARAVISVLLQVSVLTPIVEELCFRGLLLHHLKRYLPLVSAVLIGSTVFGLLHIVSSSVVHATISGILFSLLAIKSRSILPGIVTHGVSNAIDVIEKTVTLNGIQPWGWFAHLRVDHTFQYSTGMIVGCSVLALVILASYFRPGSASYSLH